jgi:hypothetical protein
MASTHWKDYDAAAQDIVALLERGKREMETGN